VESTFFPVCCRFKVVVLRALHSTSSSPIGWRYLHSGERSNLTPTTEMSRRSSRQRKWKPTIFIASWIAHCSRSRLAPHLRASRSEKASLAYEDDFDATKWHPSSFAASVPSRRRDVELSSQWNTHMAISLSHNQLGAFHFISFCKLHPRSDDNDERPVLYLLMKECAGCLDLFFLPG